MSATVARAGLITYDLTSSGPLGSLGTPSGALGNISFTPPSPSLPLAHPLVAKDVTLTISAFSFTAGGGSILTRTAEDLNTNIRGMGINSSVDSSGFDAPVDGLGANELLKFAFTKNGNPIDVELIEAVFFTFTPNGRVRLFIDGLNISIATEFGAGDNLIRNPLIGTPSPDPVYLVDFENSLTQQISDVFELGTVADNSRWRIASLTVLVPEPGTLALFGLGLVGLAFARRHRRS